MNLKKAICTLRALSYEESTEVQEEIKYMVYGWEDCWNCSQLKPYFNRAYIGATNPRFRTQLKAVYEEMKKRA